jgi:hypothetical protein
MHVIALGVKKRKRSLTPPEEITLDDPDYEDTSTKSSSE